MKRLTQANIQYPNAIEQRLQDFENVIEGWFNEQQSLKKRLEELKLQDKTKTLSYKEAYSRKLFLEYLLEELKKNELIEGDVRQ